MAWEWWKGDAGWQSVTLQVNLEILDLAVSGCPEDRYNGLYRLDLAAPTANEKPHFSNGEDMHLYYGSVNGWYFKDQYTPHESNATAYSMAVMGANTWQWWNKERAEWISYACTIAAKAPTPAPAAAPAAATPAAPAQIVGAPVAAAGASATTVAAAGESWLTAAIPMDNPCCSCKLTRVRPRCCSRRGCGVCSEHGRRPGPGRRARCRSRRCRSPGPGDPGGGSGGCRCGLCPCCGCCCCAKLGRGVQMQTKALLLRTRQLQLQ